MSVTQTYAEPQKLSQFKVNPETKASRSGKLSEFELILELNVAGWSYQFKKVSRKLEPYRRGGEKIWYYHTATMKGGINHKYLTVLALADQLFNEGLTAIYHCQPVSYYEALLKVNSAALCEILPWQTKGYYANAISQQSGQHVKKARKAVRTVEDDDAGEWVWWVWV